MTLRKVVYHPLERLDLVDVQGQQNLAHDAVFDIAGAVLNNTCSGIARTWTSLIANNSTNEITFNDFTMVGRTADGEGSATHLPAYLAKYISSRVHGSCSFGVAKGLVQTYYNTNGVLPPVPTDSDYSVSTHGAMYPYIYARPVVSESSAASRRFWDAGSESETTSTVNTRTITTFQFTVVDINSVPTVPASGFGWTRIGGINEWTVSGGVVSLSSAGVYPFFYAESFLGLHGGGITSLDFNGGILAGGVGGAFAFIMNHIQDLKSNGTSDSSGRPVLGRGERPVSSLSDLNYRLNALQSDVDTDVSPKLSESSTILLKLSFPGNNYPTLTYTQAFDNTFDMTPSLNYKPAREWLTRTESATITDFDAAAWSSHFSTDAYNAQLLSCISLQLPASKQYKHYSLSIEPIYADRGGEFIGSGSGVRADAISYARIRGGEQWFIKPEDTSSGAEQFINYHTRQAKTSSTNISFLGVNILCRSPEDWSIVADNGMVFDLKITLTIHNN